jgi:ABC-2 type transport system permease protein
LAWGALAYVVLVTMLADALNLPAWADDLSPFSWTPLVPIESWTTAAAVGLGIVAAALLAVGFGAFGRRDLTTA